MYLYSKLQDLKKPIRVAFIGCGKFVSMFLAQYSQLNKIILDTIIELDIDRAKKNCSNSGLCNETIEKINFSENVDILAKIETLQTMLIMIKVVKKLFMEQLLQKKEKSLLMKALT